MSKKGCLIGCIAVPVALVVAGYLLYQGIYNPYYKGKRVYAWADQALDSPEPAARDAAARTLMGALQEIHGEPRIQLIMRFCGRSDVPKEAIPFLVEALHADEMPSGSYPAIALSRVEGEAAVPALIDVITNDEDGHAQLGAVWALDMMLMERKSKAAEAALKHAATAGSEGVQKQAQNALKRYEEWVARYPQ
jgi:HEAT repeat protein